MGAMDVLKLSSSSIRDFPTTRIPSRWYHGPPSLLGMERETNQYSRTPPLPLSTSFKRPLIDNQQALQIPHGGNPIETTGLCPLSLDVGGARGLSTLYVLKNIMDLVNNMRSPHGQPQLKPCELFDLTGGTSTGG